MRIGLTGGIASGKSAASAILADFGARIIDYDLLAREAVQPGTPGLAAIAERFGPSVIDTDGRLDRPALGAIVFTDEQARRDLEAITHPAIRALALRRDQEAPDDAIVVHDHPLLVEMGTAVPCDVVIVIDVPVETQVERLARDRGMTPADARARIAAQTSREERSAVADVVIDNTGTLDDLRLRLREVWDHIAP